MREVCWWAGVVAAFTALGFLLAVAGRAVIAYSV